MSSLKRCNPSSKKEEEVKAIKPEIVTLPEIDINYEEELVTVGKYSELFMEGKSLSITY